MIIDCTTGVPVTITLSPTPSTEGMGVLAALIQDEQLDALLQTFDKAGAQDRENISRQIFDRCRDKVQTLIQNSVKGWPLHQADLESLSREAVMETLHARTPRLKRSDCDDWEGFVARLRSTYPPGRFIWSKLTGKLRHELESSQYLKAMPTINNLVRELNEIVRKPMFEPNAWAGVSLNDTSRALLADKNPSPSVLASTNIQFLCSAFPMIRPHEPKQSSFWGYLTKAAIPAATARAAEAGGAPFMSDHILESRNQLRGVVNELMTMASEGRLPNDLARLSLPERIHRRQLQRLQERYGPRIAWLDQQVASLSQHPFRVNNPGSLRDAKELLTRAKISESLWKYPNSQFYVPVSGLPSEAVGVQVIRKLIEMGAFGAQAQRQRTTPLAPTAPMSPSDTQAMALLHGGHAAPAFRWIVQHKFQPGTEQRAGLFLADNPQPSRQQVEQFVSTLSDAEVDDIESAGGWDKFVYHEVDRKVLDAIRDPQIEAELVRALKAVPANVNRMVDAIHRTVFIRTAWAIERRSQSETWTLRGPWMRIGT